MAKVNGYTAEHMQQIEDATIVSVAVDSTQHLIFTRHDGSKVDAGDISAVAKLSVQDSDTIDLTLTGSGTLAYPWGLKADVKELTVQALLDPLYQGQGPARVTFLPGNTLSTEYYQWIGKYERWGNRAVEMVRAGNTWRILGHTGHGMFGGKISLTPWLGPNYINYNRRSSANEYSEPRVQRLASGIVVLSGLIAFKQTGSAGELIFTLPQGTRPDFPMIFPVENSGGPRTISINHTNGEVRWEGAFTSSGNGDYLSIDGIAFPAAGVAQWTDVTEFINGWKPWSDNYRPSYWKDPYGVVWLKGLLTGGVKGADTVMFKVPASHAPEKQTHNVASTDQGFGYVSSFPTTQGSGGDRGVSWKGGNPSNAVWISVCGVRIVTPDSYAFPWNRGIFTGNGWTTTYSSQFPSLGVSRRPDGLAITEGLLGVGNAETPVANLQDWVTSEKRSILRTVSGDKSVRMDIIGMSKGEARGQLFGNSGHSAWSTVDGLAWMVGD